MKRTILASAGVLVVTVTISVIQTVREEAAAAQGQKQGAGVPTFQVDPYWPKPLPIDWTFGEFSGVAVDSHDHVWINQRPKTLADDEKYLTVNPPPGDCCAPGPSIMELRKDSLRGRRLATARPTMWIFRPTHSSGFCTSPTAPTTTCGS